MASCDPSKSPKRKYETLVFNIDQTRLGPAIMDTTLKIEMAAPKGWHAIDELMAGGTTDYEIKTEHTVLDFVISIFTGLVSIHSRTVTVTK